MEKHVSNFQLIMTAPDADLINIGRGEYGLYGHQIRNDFGTPLIARGTKEEMEYLKRGGKPA
jgi:hypothetical protein